MLQKGTAVILLTASHRFQGEINTGGQRLQEVMNNSLTDYVQIENAQIYTLANQTEMLHAEKRAIVQKSQLQLVVIGEQKHEAPAKRQNYRVEKSFHEVFCVAGSYEVTGLLHLPRYALDTIAILARDLKVFFPLTEATVTYDVRARSTLSANVALVNKAALSLFQISDN
ncbi:MAG: hypothetical protein DYG89_01360 [Caldilinea sp. CFX5]|nr:hypothetical protein [Caldilinea sp. CFX5]